MTDDDDVDPFNMMRERDGERDCERLYEKISRN